MTTNFVCPCTIFTAASVPATASVNETQPLELGVKFRSDVAGQVTGVRFYKGAGNTGTHTGHLWSADRDTPRVGDLHRGIGDGLATGVVRVAGLDPGRHDLRRVVLRPERWLRRVTAQQFQNAGVDNGPLHALQSGVDGGNGVFKYGADQRVPVRHLERGELLRRRRLHQRRERSRHDASDGDGDDAGGGCDGCLDVGGSDGDVLGVGAGGDGRLLVGGWFDAGGGDVGVQRGFEHRDVHSVGGVGGVDDVHGDDQSGCATRPAT